MNIEDFLLNIKDDIEFCIGQAENRHVKATLEQTTKKIDAQLADPEAQPRCGLYLHDGTRQYGYSFEQLQHLLKQYNNPDSVFYKYKRGFPKLLAWLYDVAHTSIGDLHGDMLKHVVATYHRPEDFKSDEELEKADKAYDEFWKQVREIFAKRKDNEN
jgi:hypothetical protein